MHDVLAHTVTAMSIQAAVASDAVELDPSAAGRALALLRRQAQRAVEDVRVSIVSLRSAHDPVARATDAVPGLAALDALVDEAGRRHSLATTATITLRAVDDALVLSITDLGPRRLPERLAGFGLIGMRERACAAGGPVRRRTDDARWVPGHRPTAAPPGTTISCPVRVPIVPA